MTSYKNLFLLINIVILYNRIKADSSSYSQASAQAYASASSSSNSSPTSECPTSCPHIFEPVCTFNGECYRTFGNKCNVQVQNCNLADGTPKYDIVANGECKSIPCYANNICECPMYYVGICAYNGICYSTFANPCFIGVNNCQNPQNYFVTQHKGPCTKCEIPVCED